MSIQNLENNIVNINPNNLRLDLARFYDNEIANGQLCWQYVKGGFISTSGTAYQNLLDPNDLCWRSTLRGRLKICIRARVNQGNASNAQWRFRLLVGAQPGQGVTTAAYGSSADPVQDEGVFYAKTGGVAPLTNLYSELVWEINYSYAPTPNSPMAGDTIVGWTTTGAMASGASLAPAVISGTYFESAVNLNITGLEVRSTDQGSLNLFEYSIYALGPS